MSEETVVEKPKRSAPTRACPKCGVVNHVRKLVCECGHEFGKPKPKLKASVAPKKAGRPKGSKNIKKADTTNFEQRLQSLTERVEALEALTHTVSSNPLSVVETMPDGGEVDENSLFGDAVVVL